MVFRVVTVLVIALVVSCEPEVAPNACNDDEECAAGVPCRDGFCTPLGEGEGEEGEGEEGEGEEGEGEEGEGEGDPGDGTCASPFRAVLGSNSGNTALGVAAQTGDADEAGCLGDALSLDQAWVITVPAGATLDVVLQSQSDVGFTVRTTCDELGAQLVCEDAGVAGSVEAASVVSDGAPLFIIVDTHAATAPGEYTLTLVSSTCGNGIREAGEECDGTEFDGLSCIDVDGGEGALACDASCQIVTSVCCGNGTAGGAEVCDGNDFNGQGCANGGTPVCAPDCGSINVDACCGNGVIAGAEVCDGNNLDGQTCESLTGLDGRLFCAGCTAFNDAGCCGNGALGVGEECDDGNTVAGDGCDAACNVELVDNHGVAYTISEGTFSTCAEMLGATPVETGTTFNFNNTDRDETDFYGYVFDAFIEIATAGDYTFHTTSDDGSILVIDNAVVVDNDGLHSPRTLSGAIALTAGRHEIHVEFFERQGQDVIEVEYEGPGVPRQEIPGAVLFLTP